MQEKGLSLRQNEVGFAVPPEIVLQNAITAAKALKDVVSKKPNPVILNGEQYLEFEDWQTCGQFYGYTVLTGEAVAAEIDGVKGAKAHADLIDLKTGEVVGGAEAYCMRDEEHWNTRPKYEWQGEGDKRKRVKIGDEIVPWFQLASMAQTRAGAKAFRNRLAWVVVLAGYRPTPAEEMTESTVSDNVKERRTVDKAEHYCPIHNVNFFKKGRMKGYAHPIEGTDDWCNEPEEPPGPTPGQRADMQTVIDEHDKKPTTPINGTESPNLTGQQAKQGEGEVKGDPVGNAAKKRLKEEQGKTYTDPETIKTIGDFFTAVKKDFNLMPEFALKEINKKSRTEITDPKAEYLIIAATFRR